MLYNLLKPASGAADDPAQVAYEMTNLQLAAVTDQPASPELARSLLWDCHCVAVHLIASHLVAFFSFGKYIAAAVTTTTPHVSSVSLSFSVMVSGAHTQ